MSKALEVNPIVMVPTNRVVDALGWLLDHGYLPKAKYEGETPEESLQRVQESMAYWSHFSRDIDPVRFNLNTFELKGEHAMIFKLTFG